MAIKSISAWFFILFLLIGGTISFFAILKTSYEKQSLINGAFTNQYEAAFDKELAHRPISINFLNSLHFVLFKEGRKGVLIGSDGWLFTDEEFALSPHHQDTIKNNQHYIIQVKNELLKNNVKLFIVPIPSKARLFEDKVGRYDYPQNWRRHYSDFLSFLGREEIPHPLDLEIILSKPDSFLKTDTHWTAEGARSVAFNAALHIEKSFPYLSWKREDFKSEKMGTREHEGDLTRYTVKQKEMINRWETTSQKEEDLFGDKDYSVVLIGTSYSANPLWNFEGFLKEALATDILNLADEGLGPFEVMKNYMSGDIYNNTKPKLVIWEIPERYLPVQTLKETKEK